MPELPEVETVVRGLKKTVLGKTIAKVTCQAPSSTILIGEGLVPKSLDKILPGKKITGIDRIGKNILIRLSENMTLWAHLKMTGHFFYYESSKPIEKHDLVVFEFKGKNGYYQKKHLRFNDYRRFGRLRLFSNDTLFKQKGLASLGPEPFDLSPFEFVKKCLNAHRMIKPALMDQTFIAGLGNIYADESLYMSRLHPERILSSISKRKLAELHGHICAILTKAIDLMGSSVDTYSGVNGQTGHYQKYLLAYNNEDQPCQRCGTMIIRKKIGSRSAHYCPKCQRK